MGADFAEFLNGFVLIPAAGPFAGGHVYGYYLAVLFGFQVVAYVPLLDFFSQALHYLRGIWFSPFVFLAHCERLRSFCIWFCLACQVPYFSQN